MPQSSDSKIVQLKEDTEVVCPTCGVLALNQAGCEPQPSCKHVRFIYCNGECFEYIEPDLQAKIEKAAALANQNDDLFDAWEWLEENSPEGTTILEQVNGGMACGPTSFTVWFGFRTADSKSSKAKRKTAKSGAKSPKGRSGKKPR
jgi:hypothetical protein